MGQLMKEEAGSDLPCLDCAGLLEGTSVAHGYLVLSGGFDSTGSREYRCLVCGTTHTLDMAGDFPRWKTRPSPAGATRHH